MKYISSKAYGSITFSKEDSFVWKNYNLLVPNVIPKGTSQDGSISIIHPISPKLRKRYDGVLTLSFHNSSIKNINFLFKLTELGVKLVYVPPGDIDENYVKEENQSPLVIFMSSASE